MMELGTREILLAVGLLLIVVIVLDGIRRMRQSNHGQIRMARRQRVFEDDDLDYDPYAGELTGEVRVRERGEEQPGQVRVREREEPVVGLETRMEPRTTARKTPDESALDQAELDPKPRVLLDDEPDHAAEPGDPVELRTTPRQEALNLGDEEPPVSMRSTRDPAPRKPPGRKVPNDMPRRREPEPEPEVMALHVMAPQGGQFSGDHLLNELMANDLRYGSMKIFHRHADHDGVGPVLFSLANSVKPGTFDLNAMDRFSTPGISLFMALDDVDDPSDAFEQMLDAAHHLAEGLGGELKDESRSALTRQTKDHLRQRVKEFERRRLYRVTDL